MPHRSAGEVWMVDLGMAAKVRPCVTLTLPGLDNDLDVVTVVAHTTSIRGSYWEVSIPKPFLKEDGAFDVQRIATVATAKLERKLGQLSAAELEPILNRIAERFGIKAPF
jgi:mRNA interferase MazF